MRKTGLFTLVYMLIFFITGMFPACAEESSFSSLVARVKPAVVFVIAYDGKNKVISRGTGFFVNGRGEFITSRHVLYGAVRAEIMTSDEKTHVVRGIVSEDREADLVGVAAEVPANKYPVLKIFQGVTQTGDKIIVVGNPLGLEFSVSDGIISAVREIPGSGRIIQITAPISPGSSGSPVLDMDGNVVGLASFQLVKGQNLNFAVPAEKLLQLKFGKLTTLTDWRSGVNDAWAHSPEGLYHSGLTRIYAEDYSGAVEFLKQAIVKNPKYTDAYFNLGYAYGLLKKYDDALEAFKQTIKLRPEDPDAYYNLGVIYGRTKRPEEAIKAYKRAMQLKPEYVNAMYNLGIIYGAIGKYDESVDMLKRVIDLRSDYTGAYYNLGVTYGKLKRNEEAITVYKMAIKLDPDHVNTHYNLGVTYLITGNSAGALREYKILKTLDKSLAEELFLKIYSD